MEISISIRNENMWQVGAADERWSAQLREVSDGVLGGRRIRQFVRPSADWAEHRIQSRLAPMKSSISLMVIFSEGNGQMINLPQVSLTA